MNFSRHRPNHDYHFDLTALIDVVFLLLAFFVMGSQFAQTQRAPLDLPQQVGEQATAESPLVLVVDLAPDGGLMIEGRAVTRDEFVSIVRHDLAPDAQGTVRELDLIIRADQKTPSGVLSVLARDVARVGVRKWKIATTGGAL